MASTIWCEVSLGHVRGRSLLVGLPALSRRDRESCRSPPKNAAVRDGVAGHWCSDLRFDQIRIDGPEGKGVSGLRSYLRSENLSGRCHASGRAFRRSSATCATSSPSLVRKGMHVLLRRNPRSIATISRLRSGNCSRFRCRIIFGGERPSLHSMVEGMRRLQRCDTTTGNAGGSRPCRPGTADA